MNVGDFSENDDGAFKSETSNRTVSSDADFLKHFMVS